MIQLAHSINLSVVAEGVETEARFAFLEAAGCNLIQGYLLGRPVGAPAIHEFLKRSAKVARERSHSGQVKWLPAGAHRHKVECRRLTVRFWAVSRWAKERRRKGPMFCFAPPDAIELLKFIPRPPRQQRQPAESLQ